MTPTPARAASARASTAPSLSSVPVNPCPAVWYHTRPDTTAPATGAERPGHRDERPVVNSDHDAPGATTTRRWAARCTARRAAAALFSVSVFSVAATESATMPPPA